MISNTDGFTGKLRRSDSRPICPECGSIMKMADYSRENGIQYTWYACSNKDCHGQWLERDAAVSPMDKWYKYRRAASRINGM